MTVSEDEATVYGTGEWIVNARDLEQIKNWRAEDVAAEAMRSRDSKEKKAKKDFDPLFEALDPVREAYRKTNSVGKQAIIAALIEYITR